MKNIPMTKKTVNRKSINKTIELKIKQVEKKLARQEEIARSVMAIQRHLFVSAERLRVAAKKFLRASIVRDGQPVLFDVISYRSFKKVLDDTSSFEVPAPRSLAKLPPDTKLVAAREQIKKLHTALNDTIEAFDILDNGTGLNPKGYQNVRDAKRVARSSGKNK